MAKAVEFEILTGGGSVYVFKTWSVETFFSPHAHLSLNREDRWGTTNDFTTNFLHFSLFSTAVWKLGELQVYPFP